jgi:hypothetical protein
MTYSEKPKDPRWQRKRLEIMERDGFKCIKCKAENQTLHVHHVAYLRGKAPWEHPDSGMITLCVKCHDRAEFTTERFKEILCRAGREGIDLLSLVVMMDARAIAKHIKEMKASGVHRA